ncbi:MAG: Ig-like domain-containing protein, partial [Clostridia bacterium]|nr:Ig-like domain-containing protein [Clostridia bacterium]
MKARKTTVRKISLLITAIVVLALLVGTVMVATAEENVQVVGEMVEIQEAFANYLVQNTVVGSDKYVGDYQYTVYYDASRGAVKSGYDGTPVIIYTINTGVEKIGTDSNTKIIQSMIDRGYAVVVLDYLNNAAAVSPALDLSAQQFRLELVNGYGKIFTNTDVFTSGSYREHHLVPSGYNVSLGNVFWEIDKHSADGTFEKIVENWNSDFRATKGGKLVYWMHENGNRKAVQNDFDGNEPVWYDADGKVDENGEYTYIKYTKAEVITDCVDPDGSFIEMDLKLHIIYPTSPVNEVPVIAMASSSGYPSYSPTSDGGDESLRPHSAGALFNGYAFAVFDYLWQPMGRSASWGYYDGAQGVSKDHMNYSLHIYNDKLVNTAAMRYIRYTSLSGGTTFNFDIDKIGVIGNSKGGWFNFLGEKIVQSPLVDATKYATSEAYEDAISLALESFVSERTYNGYHGATRYSVGKGTFSGDGITLAAGEAQPWLTWDGKEIISGCQITVPENGGSAIDITEGHMPIFVTSNMDDYLNAHYGVTLNIYNTCKTLDLPLMHLELPIGHSFPYGKDINYNVDSYDIFLRFANYYLKNGAITVAYITPMDNAGGVSSTEKITIAFVGQAKLSEVEKITVTAADGTAVSGTWESSFGGVKWTFTPSALSGNTEYTVTIPADFAGTNGTAMGKAYTSSFITEFGKDTAPESVSENAYTFIAPEFTTGNSFVFRFNVSNDAANVAEVYATSTDGEKLGSVNLRGKGSYEVDITNYVAANAGKEITLVLKASRAAGNTVVKSDDLSADLSAVEDVSLNTTNVSFTYGNEIGDRVALGASLNKAYNYTYSKYYNNPTKIITYNNVTGGKTFTKDDLGRLYTFSIDIYDTVDRVVQLRLRDMTDKTGHQTIDYDNVRLNVKTVANEWTTYTFTYRVYEPDYGTMSSGKVQRIEVLATPDGDTASSIYLSNLVVTENVTEINVANAVIAEKREGGFAYSAPASASPFAIYNGDTLVGEYEGWAAALDAYTSGYTIKLQSDYTFTDADASGKLGSFDNVNLDLGAYTVTLANTANSLIWVKATNASATNINISGGLILIGDTPLISYESASAAGSGKNVSIDFASVDIGLDEGSMATNLISATSLTSGITLKSNISFTDCDFNFPDAKRVYDGATIFPSSTSAGLDLSYTLKGGSLSITSERWLTIIETVDSVNFAKNINGDYTSLIMPASHTYPLDGAYLSENGYVSYAPASEENNLVTYEFEVSENATPYGVIPDNYADGEAYPFVLFKNGDFISAHTTLLSASNAARDIMSAAGCENEEAVILVRDDWATTTSSAPEFGISRGTIIFDLDGHTLKREKSAFLSETLRASYPTSYKTSVVFKNGRVETAGSSMFTVNNFYSTNSTKYFEFTFENVTFGSASGATKLHQSAWISSWINGHKATTIDTKITLRDCTFDLETNRPTLTSTATLFTFGTYECVFDLVIEGGKIIGDGSNVKIASIDKYDALLTLAPNAKGEYLKFIPSSGGTAPDISNFEFDDGKYRTFVLNETSGEYILSEGGVETPYGTISADYADTEAYPFAMFQGGECVGAYADWKAATVAIPTYASETGSEATLLLRRDYDNTGYAANDSAFNQVRGTVTVDLGGFTFTRGATIFSFATFNNTYSTRVGTFIIKNGTLLAFKGQIFANQTNAKNKAEKVWNITVENVTFGFAEGTAGNSNMFWASYTNSTSATHGAKTNVTFNNCTFDLKSNYPASKPHLFDFLDDKSLKILDYNVAINGGKILCDDLNSVVLYDINAGDDTVTFGQYNGEYIKLISASTAKDASHYAKPLPVADGDGYFVEISDDGINSVYELTSLTTSYGTASATAKYLSAVDYPFYIFHNGEFVGAASTWKEAMTTARGLVGEAADTDLFAEIVMRRDYDIYKATEGSVTFNTARGTVILDLGGYRITTVDGYLIDIAINNETASFLGYESRFVVRNGEILNKRATLPSIGIGHSKASPDGKKKTLTFTFENVTFKTTGYSIIRDWGHSGTTGLNVNVVFDNCVYDFDYHNDDEVMFHFNSGNARVVTNVKFVGGKIIASPIGNYRLINNRSEDTVVFAKDGDGNYTALVQPTKLTNVAPKDTFVNDSGLTLAFVEEKIEGNNTIYRLISKKPENLEFVPKSSITLGSELVYNVYVPVNDYLTSFTLDGVEYADFTELSKNIITLDDGNDYYLISIPLAAKEAARNIVLAVKVTVDGRAYNATFTMSVVKYAAALLETSTSEEEKTLVKDVLQYIRAAYTYFGTEDAEQMAKIDTLLGDYASKPAIEGSDVADTTGMKSATLVLSGKPSIRFYLADGANASEYKFYIGGKQIKTVVSEDGTYIDTDVYAYELCETVTYTVGGEAAGSFHINA